MQDSVVAKEKLLDKTEQTKPQMRKALPKTPSSSEDERSEEKESEALPDGFDCRTECKEVHNALVVVLQKGGTKREVEELGKRVKRLEQHGNKEDRVLNTYMDMAREKLAQAREMALEDDDDEKKGEMSNLAEEGKKEEEKESTPAATNDNDNNSNNNNNNNNNNNDNLIDSLVEALEEKETVAEVSRKAAAAAALARWKEEAAAVRRAEEQEAERRAVEEERKRAEEERKRVEAANLASKANKPLKFGSALSGGGAAAAAPAAASSSSSSGNASTGGKSEMTFKLPSPRPTPKQQEQMKLHQKSLLGGKKSPRGGADNKNVFTASGSD